MAASYFGDKANPPDDTLLAGALGETGVLWDSLMQGLDAACEWKFYSKAAGWSCAVKLGKRTLFYMMPKEGHFTLTFVYGEKAVAASADAGLPQAVLDDLQQARAYAEGRSVSIDVRGEGDLDTARRMLDIKRAN